MAAAGARAQKPVGSAAWIATEKENMAELLEQEMEEVEYPVRHEMEWLNEHMAEIFSKGQANFMDVFKTPGKMRGKTPRTARKRNAEESRVPLSEIFSSAHKQVENKAISPSPFIHRVVSKTATASMSAAPRAQEAENISQPKYPDLSQNLDSFPRYNTDSGYHGMDDGDQMVLPDTQPETQTSTQPLDNEPVGGPSQADVSMSQQTAEDSFHSAQENVRARGETVEPMDVDATPTQERTTRSATTKPKEEEDATPKYKPSATGRKQHEKSTGQQEVQKQDEEKISPTAKSSPPKPPVSQSQKTRGNQSEDVEMEEAKEDTVLGDIDDIGSPSDGSTPERPLVRKSSLTFASLPAREPLTKSRISRTSHIDLPKLSRPDRSSYFGRQTGGHRTTQPAPEDNAAESGAMDVDDEKSPGGDGNMDQASKLHNKKSTQSLHERISMLGKLQPSRPKKSIPMAGLSSGHSANLVAYPDLPASKQEGRPETSSQKTRETPVAEPMTADEDDWIKPLSSPQRPNLANSKTTDAMEKLPGADGDPSASKKDIPAEKEQHPAEPERPKSSTSVFSSPRIHGHQQSASTSNISAAASTTPVGSPRRFDGPLSASKMRLHSIMKSAKGLFTSTGSMERTDHSSPEQPRFQSQEQVNVENDENESHQEPQPRPISSPPRQEARRTRSSTEREEKRRQKELEERQQEEARQDEVREQERQRDLLLKAAQDKSSVEPEERAQRQTQPQRQQSREPESSHESSRHAIPQLKQNDRRPKPTREPVQKPKPQPVSIRVGSTLSRMPMATSVSSSVPESNVSAPVPAPAPAPAPAPTPALAPASKPATLKKKGSNQSLQTSSSTSSFKSSVSSQTQAQRKAQLANDRRKEQEEREARRREEQRREQERKRAAQQQQDEARRQAMRSRAESRAEAEREQREGSVHEDPKKAAHMQAIEKRRLENARRHERQGSQQAINEGPILQHEKANTQSSQRNDLGASRPPSRLGSMQPYGRAINPPAPNPTKPLKRNMDEEASHRPAVTKPSNVQPSGEAKRRKTDDEHNPMQAVRPTMPPPIRQSNIRKPSMFGQAGTGHPSGSSIFKNAQPQRPAHPMAKYANGKIPFAEPNHAPPPAAHKPSAPGSGQRPAAPAKPSPKYPSGENIHLPEIATDSEDEEDSDSEMFPVPKWAQPKELEGLLRQQDGIEVDSIFGPIAPFSLEETFKADKKIKKYRDRTSSANWNGPDGLTQDEVRKDLAERQRLRLNGGWSFNP